MTEPGKIVYVNLADLRFVLFFCEHCEEHTAVQETLEADPCPRCGGTLRVVAGPMDFGELDEYGGEP